MRLPGFIHQKAEPFRTRIMRAADRIPYEAVEIIAEAGVEVPPPNGADGEPSAGDGEDRATGELIRALLGGEDFHGTLLALAMRYAKGGMPDGQIIGTLKGMMSAVPAEKRGTDSRWLARYNEIPRLVRSAREKMTAAELPVTVDYELLCDLKPILANNYIVKGLIDRHVFVEIHSDRSAGKTAILVDLLLHVAAGIEYRERRVVQQPVVYVALEGHKGISNRLFAAKQQLGIIDAPFGLVRATRDFRAPETAKKVAEIAQRLMNTFGGDCPVIAIDTFTAALGAGSSDCDPKDVTKFIANIQQHLLATCTVIIAHHFGKDSSRGGRGWSGLGAALDFELEIDRDGDLRTMRVTKSSDGSDRQPAFCYNFAGREIGIDEDGDPVTTVVVEHLADQTEPRRGKRHSPKARAALNVLWEMIKDRIRSFPLPDQPGLRCVLLADWEAACIAAGGISKSHEKRDRRKQFRIAKAELEAANSIVCDSTEAGGFILPRKTSGNERENFGDATKQRLCRGWDSRFFPETFRHGVRIGREVTGTNSIRVSRYSRLPAPSDSDTANVGPNKFQIVRCSTRIRREENTRDRAQPPRRDP